MDAMDVVSDDSDSRSTVILETSCDQTFAKDSFDRFGDDLCQQILSFISIEHKLDQLVLVSKQWKHCLINGQTKLIFTTNPLLRRHSNDVVCLRRQVYSREIFYKIRPFVRRFPNITHFEFQDMELLIDGRLLRLIADYWPKLTTFVVTNAIIFQAIDEDMVYFGQRVGQNISHLKIVFSSNTSSNEQLIQRSMSLLLSFTPNIRDIHLPISFGSTEQMVINYSKLRLESMNLSNLLLTEEELTQFVDIFGTRLKRLVFLMTSSTYPSLGKCLEQISRLKSLKQLSIRLDIKSKPNEKLDNSLRQLSSNLKQLKCLRLEVISSKQFMDTIITGKWFDILATFSSLTRLRFALILDQKTEPKNYLNQFVGSFQSFLHSPQLRHIFLVFTHISDDILDHIGHSLPQLLSFRLVCCQSVITDKTLLLLAEVPALMSIKMVELLDNSCDKWCIISDDGVQQLLDQCLRLRSVELNCCSTITSTSVNAFIRRALLAPKRQLCFRLKNDSNILQSIDLTQNIPKNLDIQRVDNEYLNVNCLLMS